MKRKRNESRIMWRGKPLYQKNVLRSLEASGSRQTKVRGWSYPRVDWTNAVAFRYTWVHLGALVTRLGVPMTRLGVPLITVKQSVRNINLFGKTAGASENQSYYLTYFTG